ncbi:YnhF family membrane protein [Vibrio sp.]|uniref:YnhF family membrane protein n=1 Tax=Vibrio viridaestus TaxID=2487322 RepID=A0A3N9U7R8_9VIBR|nr:YnhF family membrane protein [Vibrio viridaestus]MDC0612567.1 YnhF family membrane protein [Vibrio sp.]RQW64226.1 YnhF family membrane protein [Vibrio viridaestus]
MELDLKLAISITVIVFAVLIACGVIAIAS